MNKERERQRVRYRVRDNNEIKYENGIPLEFFKVTVDRIEKNLLQLNV